MDTIRLYICSATFRSSFLTYFDGRYCEGILTTYPLGKRLMWSYCIKWGYLQRRRKIVKIEETLFKRRQDNIVYVDRKFAMLQVFADFSSPLSWLPSRHLAACAACGLCCGWKLDRPPWKWKCKKYIHIIPVKLVVIKDYWGMLKTSFTSRFPASAKMNPDNIKLITE